MRDQFHSHAVRPVKWTRDIRRHCRPHERLLRQRDDSQTDCLPDEWPQFHCRTRRDIHRAKGPLFPKSENHGLKSLTIETALDIGTVLERCHSPIVRPGASCLHSRRRYSATRFPPGSNRLAESTADHRHSSAPFQNHGADHHRQTGCAAANGDPRLKSRSCCHRHPRQQPGGPSSSMRSNGRFAERRKVQVQSS